MRLVSRCGVGARLRAAPLAVGRPRHLSTPPPPSAASLAPRAIVAPGLLQYPGMYIELSKAKLSALVVLTTGAGHLMAQAPFDPALLGATLGGTFLCAASANTLNQVIEVPRDARMARTARRPLPSGRMTPEHALGFAAVAGLGGVGSLAILVNPTTAVLGAATIGLYAGVYTPLKPLTPYNTWVGAAVGAVPPLMGWAAAGGSLLTPEAFVLSSALFLWQIPHFLALAWMYRADYAAGGYAMMPLHDPTGARTASVCLEYSCYLTALPVGCWAAGITSCMFPLEGVLFNGAMLFAAARFMRASLDQRVQQAQHARGLFFVSLAYLPFFFFCLLLHQRQRETDDLSLSSTATAGAGSHLTRGCSAFPPFSDEEADVEGSPEPIAEARGRLRERGRRLCLHDKLEAPSLCPVVATEGVVGSVVDELEGAVEKATDRLAKAQAQANRGQ